MNHSADQQASRASSVFLWGFIAVLTVIGLAYIAKGALIGATAHHPIDLTYIWTAQQKVMHGQDPYAGDLPSPYPPPTFVLGATFMWPSSWTVARGYWTAINLVAIATTALWAFRLGRPFGRSRGCLLAASFIAMGSICHTLGLGQAGVVVTAMLVLLLWLEEKRSPVAQGLVLGASFFKPQISGLFVLSYLAKRRWDVVIVAGIYSLAAWLVVCWVTHAPVLECFEVWGRMSKAGVLDHGNPSPYRLLQMMGMSAPAALKVTGLVIVTATLITSIVYRRRSMLVQFAIVAVGGRLCTYHGTYDDVMLVFLLMVLGVEMLYDPRSRATIGFVLTGLSLWMPARMGDHASYAIFQLLAWPVALAVLLSITPHECTSGVESSDAPDVSKEVVAT